MGQLGTLTAWAIWIPILMLLAVVAYGAISHGAEFFRRSEGTSKWWLWFPLGIILGGILVVVVPAVSDQLQRWLTRDGLDLLWKIAVLLCLIRLNLKR